MRRPTWAVIAPLLALILVPATVASITYSTIALAQHLFGPSTLCSALAATVGGAAGGFAAVTLLRGLIGRTQS